MIRLGGLVSQKAFGKFEMGKVISNPFATAFIKEGEGEDHEVSMANNSIDIIIKMATELKAKMGEDEKQIPAWIQDHIAKAENLISQASGNYHEYGDSNESVVNNDINNIDESVNEAINGASEPLKLKGIKINKKSDVTFVLEVSFLIGDEVVMSYLTTGTQQEAQKLKSKVEKAFNTGKIVSPSGIGYYAYNESVNEAAPCWKGYKQVGMKDKGGKQVPNCVPEGKVNEAPNTGEKIQNLNNRIKALKDKMAATKSSEQKNLIQQRLKNALQTLSNYKKQNISKESVVREASGRVPQIFLKTGAVEKKIKELMADRKKAVVPYNTEKDPTKKESLKQILIKLTKQIQGYEKNLVQLRDKEEEYIQQMQADAELDTSAFD
jgi:hypothetical protein